MELWTTTKAHPWQAGKARALPDHGETADLTVTPHERQAWEGFGGCFNELGWQALAALPAARRNEVFTALFGAKGCRFTICRLPIGASDYAAEWYSHNEADGDLAMKHFSIDRDRHFLLPYIKEALKLQPKLQLFASPWSPPTWMKAPKAYNYGTVIWEKPILEAYALYFVKFVQAYAREGVTIHQIHPQNEPAADQKFPSCLWTGPQLRDFIRDYLTPAFRKAGLKTEIWLGTLNTDDYNGFPNTVLSDAAANACVTGVAFQWAGKGAIQRTRASWPEKRLMQSENECGNGQNSWEYAHYVFDLMQHYITNGVNAYVYWNMVLPPGGRSTWGWLQNAMITVDPARKTVTYNPEFFLFKHFSQFVRPGAVNLEVSGHAAGNAVAYRNPDGTGVVVTSNPFPTKRRLTVEMGANTAVVELPPQSFNTLLI